MKRMKMWKSLCVVLTATMVLTAGGCGASTGQATASASVEKSLQDPEDITSAVQENSDTSDVLSKTESEKENTQPSVAGEEETSEAVRLEDEEDTLAFPAGMPWSGEHLNPANTLPRSPFPSVRIPPHRIS